MTTTLLGLGAFPEDHPLSLGMLGMHGTAYANKAVQHCDLIMSVGSRWDDRIVGKLEDFCPHARKIHVDIDPAEITAIGSHGHTIRHRPPSGGAAVYKSFTLQIGDPNTIAERTGVRPLVVSASADWVKLEDFEGDAVAITNDGRPKIILLFAHWCPHCQNEVPVVTEWLV